MARKVEFEGATHEFPDDFTDAEISGALSGAAAPPVSSVDPTGAATAALNKLSFGAEQLPAPAPDPGTIGGNIGRIFSAPTIPQALDRAFTGTDVPISERIARNMGEGAKQTLAGGAIATGESVLDPQGYAAKRQAFEQMPTAQSIPEMLAALAGQIAPQFLAPENYIPPAKLLGRAAAPAMTRGAQALEGAQAAAVGNIVTEPAIQSMSQARGDQQGLDGWSALAGVVLGGAIGATPAAVGAVRDQFKAWRAKNGVGPDTIDLPPEPAEVDIFMRSPDAQAAMAANNIAPDDPRAAVLANRLKKIRAEEGSPLQPGEKPTLPEATSRGAEVERKGKGAAVAGNRYDAEVEAQRKERETVKAQAEATADARIADGTLDPASRDGYIQGVIESRMGRRDVASPPEVIAPPVTRETQTGRTYQLETTGTARDEGVRAGVQNQDRAVGEQKTQAQQAFDLAARQRDRVATDVRDTQPAGRPEGVNAKPVALDDGFPVEIVERRMVPDPKGNMVEVARVRRYDPRTGAPDPDGIEYEVPVRQLKNGNYATEPRRAQDFVEEAQSPRNPEQTRTPEGAVRQEPDQTYRVTQQDPNTDLPGAGPGRSPLPEQPAGPMPGRGWSRAEDAARDFADRQARGEQSRTWTQEEAKANSGKSSSTADKADQSGRFGTDPDGFVRSDKGGPVVFRDQMQAAKWILNVGQKNSPDQIFEIANHPSGKGFTVRERGRSDPPPGGGKQQEQQAPQQGAPRALPGPVRAEPAPRAEAPPPPPPRAAPRPDAAEPALAREAKQQPQSLIQWIRSAGGMKDPGGDVRSMAGDARSRPGLVSNSGMSPDDMALSAWEQGYLGGKGRTDRPTINELLDAINEDLRGNRQYSDRDQVAVTERTATEKFNAETERLADELGLDARTATRGEIQERWNERLSQEEQAARYAEIDDAIAAEHATLSERAAKHQQEKGDAWEPEYAREDAGGDPRRGQGAGDSGPPGGGPREMEGSAGQGRDGRDRVGPAGEGLKTETVRTADGPREQGVMPGMERSAKQAQASRDAAGGLKTDAPQKAADDGLFAPPKDKRQGGMELGAFGTPQQWANAIGWPVERYKAWRAHQQDMARTLKADLERGRGDKVVQNWIRRVILPADSWIRGVAKEFSSPTLNSVIDKINARAGDDAGKAVGKTWQEAVSSSTEGLMGKLEKALGKTLDDPAQMAQVVKLVQNPGNIRPGTAIHDAAKALSGLLKDVHGYMRAAGVEVGEIKNGYFPRVTEMAAIAKDPAGFVADAKRAFMLAGASAKDAAALAAEWRDAVLFGKNQASPFALAGGDAHANFLKGRTLPKQADEIMRRWLVQDPSQVLSTYVSSAVRRAETARRFGDRWKDWEGIEDAIRKEGATGALPALRDYVASAAGVVPPGMSPRSLSVMTWARTMTTLGTLEAATISSLMEPVLAAVRTGNLLDAGRAYKNTVRLLFGSAKGDAKRLREIAEDIGAISSAFNHSLMAERWSGGDTFSRTQSKVQSAFFVRTGLEQWTNATREASVSIGETFLRRLAKDPTSNLTTRSLAELGVPPAKAAQFIAWLRATKDGRPELGDLKGENGEFYKSALFRFTDQTIMRPNASTRPVWATTPLGRVVFQLQSFQYAFTANVLGRAGRRVFDAVDPRSALTGWERAKLASQVFMPLVVYGAAQAGLSMARDALRSDPVQRKEEPDGMKALRIASRMGVTGYGDLAINTFTGARYGRDPATTLSGPGLSRFLDGIAQHSNAILRNTPNTNTQERALAKWYYDVVLEPTANLALSLAAPGSSIAAAALTQGIGMGSTREAFIKSVAGEKQQPGGRAGGRAPGRSETRPSTR
jgi:hypothetical protein